MTPEEIDALRDAVEQLAGQNPGNGTGPLTAIVATAAALVPILTVLVPIVRRWATKRAEAVDERLTEICEHVEHLHDTVDRHLGNGDAEPVRVRLARGDERMTAIAEAVGELRTDVRRVQSGLGPPQPHEAPPE